jgi:tetratricopeptide (TPR) repeat protein
MAQNVPLRPEKTMVVDPELEEAINDYLDAAVELEKDDYNSDIEPFQAYASRLRSQLAAGLLQFQQNYAHGYRVLVDEVHKIYPEKDISHLKANASNLQLFDDPAASLSFFAEGKALHELLGFTGESMVEFYEAACHLFEEHRYQDAVVGFFFLVTIAPEVAEYWLDLGYAYAQQDQYQAAIECYVCAMKLEPQRVDAYLACAGTYIRMQDFEQAEIACDIGLKVALPNRGEPWAEELGTLLEEAKQQIEELFNKSKYGTFTS